MATAKPNVMAQAKNTAKYGDLRRRLVFLVLALLVYRIGAHIPVPGIDPDQLAQLFQRQSGGILGMFNLFSGGALSRFTVFALGIMPYISASIIMQLLTIVLPQLESLKKEGQAGQRKITQYTRYGTVILATFQALGIAVALEAQPGLVLDPGLMFRATAVITLVTGTMFLMWLGEQITERGLGNGISIIIFGGIAAGLPNAIGGLFELVRTGSMGIFSAILVVAIIGAVTFVVVFIERGQLSPVLRPFFGASRIDIGELTEIAGTPTRGALASVALRVVGSPMGAMRHPSGIPKDDIALSNAIFAVRLEKQRRPPPRDVWLITDIIDTSCVGSNRPL